ncbi:hypothetical protein SDC9_179189 [bioreactor metagenome]|uniref:Transcriptional coactivator p15 (PC4) C-terminal domain-containing protein n=1 Tax=bioreactor metagenome TaxID=1076179 RepID=A0A645GY27_9ZZZZ|nr:YdbC family protein [Candidatus Pelethousia sp.]
MAEGMQYDIVKHIGVLSESSKGWRKELNRVSWNGREPKYDLREWAPHYEKMGKGITMTDAECALLLDFLRGELGG